MTKMLIFLLGLWLTFSYTVTSSTPDTGQTCDGKLDIVFVLDSSGSILDANYTEELNFVSDLVMRFKGDVKYSALIFSTDLENLFHFNETHSKAEVVQRIKSARHMKAKTFTNKALDYVATQSLSPAHGARPGVQKVVIILTDGRSDAFRSTIKAAQELKKLRPLVISIGVGDEIDKFELQAIATSQKNVFTVKDFDALNTISHSITNMTCTFSQQTLPPITTTSMTGVNCQKKADVVFVLDASTSVGAGSFQQLLDFTRNVTEHFQVGPSDTQFAAITYGEHPRVEFDLNNFTTNAGVSQGVTNIKYLNGPWSYTDRALALANSHSFTPQAGHRPNVPKVVVLVTDGSSTDPVKSVQQANILKSQGVTVISVGVKNYNTQELRDISSLNVFTVNDFNILKNIQTQLEQAICDSGLQVTKTTPIIVTSPDYLTESSTEINTETTMSTTFKPLCKTKADIVFILDTSGSIFPINFPKELQFANEITKRFALGPNDVQFGVIVFGLTNQIEFNLNAHVDHSTLSKAILNITYYGGSTPTYKGLALARTQMFTPSGGARPGVKRIAIVITDGSSNSKPKTAKEAQNLKYANVTIMTIGVGQYINPTELNTIASGPSDVFNATSFNALNSIEAAVANRTCEAATVPPTSPTTPTTPPVETPSPTPEVTTEITESSTPETSQPSLLRPTAPVCDSEADIVFILDGSASIGGPDFQKELNFTDSITKSFSIGPNAVQFGVVQFGTSINDEFDLNKYSSHSGLSQAIMNIQYMSGGNTYTYKALDFAGKTSFNTNAGARPGVPKIAIVITDGRSSVKSATISAAQRLKNNGVLILSIGVGTGVDKTELDGMATNVNDVFTVNNYNVINTIRAAVVNRTCQAATRPPTSETTTQNPTTSVCDSEADIVFLLDGSGSIGGPDFQRELNFTNTLTKSFSIGPNAVQFSVVQFGTTARDEFDLNKYSSHSGLSQAISNIVYMSGGDTNTDIGLDLVRTKSLTTSAGARAGVPKIVIVITDGDSASRTRTVSAAQKLKNNGVLILSIGVGSGVNTNELNGIATNVNDVFTVNNYNVINTIQHAVVNRTCRAAETTTAPTTTPPTTPVCDSEADIVFILDGSASIGVPDFQKELNFANTLTKSFSIGPNAVQFSVVQFGTTAQDEFDLNRYSSHSSLSNAIMNINYLNDGYTYTNKGLDMARTKSFSASSGARPGVPKIAIVITDGQSAVRGDTLTAANNLKNIGALIISIGVGSGANIAELNDIATNVNDVFTVTNYNVINTIQHAVLNRTCRAAVTTPAPKCESKADILFILDTSASIGFNDFQIQLQFASNLTHSFKVGPNDVQFAAISFDYAARIDFNLKDYNTNAGVSSAIQKIQYTKGFATHTDEAIKLARNQGFLAANGGRPNVPRLVIVITDGVSNRPTDTVNEAKLLKSSGVTVIAVGVAGYFRTELDAIATSPKDVFTAQSYNVLGTIQHDVINRTCNVVPVNDTKGCTNDKVDVVFVVDSSSTVGLANFRKQMTFISNFIRDVKVGVNATQAALVTFSSKVHNQFFLNKYHTKAALINAITSTPYFSGLTHTGEALAFARNTTLTPQNGLRNDSRKLVIVLTDGRSTYPSFTRQQAQLLGLAGIKVIAIGIGKRAVRSELEMLATDLTDVFMVASFNALQGIENSVRTASCDKCAFEPTDVVFLLDSSTSEGPIDFKKQVNFAKEYIKRFGVSPQAMQVAVVSFDNIPHKEFGLTDHTTQAAVQSALSKVSFHGGGTYIGEGLKYVRNNILGSGQGSRSYANKVVILVTDGVASDPLNAASESKQLTQAGVHVVAVGIGGSTSMTQLQLLASDPSNVYTVNNFDNLTAIQKDVQRFTCNISSTTTYIQTSNAPAATLSPLEACSQNLAADIVFVLDNVVSVTQQDLQAQKLFISAITRSLQIDSTHAQIGVVTLTDPNNNRILLNQYGSKSAFDFALQSYQQTPGAKNHLEMTAKVLDNQLFKNTYGARAIKGRFVVIISHTPSVNPLATVSEVNSLKANSKVKVITVSVGLLATTEMAALASDPSHAFSVGSFSAMTSVVTDIRKLLCAES